MTTMIANAIWQSANLPETDCSTWDLSGVTTLHEGAVQCGRQMSGILSLPSIQTIAANNFNNFSQIQGFVLATNLTLSTLGTNVFNNCAALKSVVIGNAKAGCTIGENSFGGSTRPTDVTFLGKYDSAAADRVLSGTAATEGAKTATLHASSALGWDQAIVAPTEAEVAVKPTTATGVYRAGSRKAWFANFKSPFDPRHTILLIR